MFKCTRCGECCHSPRLSKQDIERIKNEGYKENDFVFTDEVGNKYTIEQKDWCIFLEKEKISTCKIYNARPNICRIYPRELNKGSCKPVKLAFDKYLEKKWKKGKE
jgi:Fe-S-cluster containining protein